MTTFTKVILLITAGAAATMLAIFAILMWFPEKKWKPEEKDWVTIDLNARNVKRQEETSATKSVRKMVTAGIARRIDKPTARVWVDPVLWERMSTQSKEECAKTLALFCSPDRAVITIYDDQSSRKIATWGWTKGLEISE